MLRGGEYFCSVGAKKPAVVRAAPVAVPCARPSRLTLALRHTRPAPHAQPHACGLFHMLHAAPRRSPAAKPSKPKKKADSDDDSGSDFDGDGGDAPAPSRQSSGRRASGSGKKYVEEDSDDSMS